MVCSTTGKEVLVFSFIPFSARKKLVPNKSIEFGRGTQQIWFGLIKDPSYHRYPIHPGAHSCDVPVFDGSHYFTLHNCKIPGKGNASSILPEIFMKIFLIVYRIKCTNGLEEGEV
jgi:hypothetical protein